MCSLRFLRTIATARPIPSIPSVKVVSPLANLQRSRRCRAYSTETSTVEEGNETLEQTNSAPRHRLRKYYLNNPINDEGNRQRNEWRGLDRIDSAKIYSQFVSHTTTIAPRPTDD